MNPSQKKTLGKVKEVEKKLSPPTKKGSSEMTDVKNQKWEKHKSFSTGLDRLTYVDLCFQGFKNEVQIAPASSGLETRRQAEVSSSAISVDAVVRKLTKRFCSREDTQNFTHFQCAGCVSLLPSISCSWLRNPHLPSSAETPVCESCLASVLSTQKKLSTEELSLILSDRETS